MTTAAEDPGTVYLLHLDPAYKHARHYIGWTKDLPARLERHREGKGARLMEVIKQAGGGFHLARTWAGGRDRERAIKDRHEAPKLCPTCSAQPKPVHAGRSAQAASPAAPSSLRREAPARCEPGTRQPGTASPSPPEAWAWPGGPAPAPDPEMDAVVAALIRSWRSPEAGAQHQAAQMEAGS